MQRSRRFRQWLILPPTRGEAHRGGMEMDEYRRLAEVEDRHWYFRSLHAHVRRELRSRHGVEGAVEALDAGCGTGGFIARMNRTLPSWRWSGIDFMPLACELARKRLPDATIREASVTELPFPDASFAAVTALDVITQVPYPGAAAKALVELGRVLKPGGTVVINAAAYRWLWSYHDEACQTQHRFAAAELAELARSAGLVPLRLTHWNALTLPLVVIRRKILARPATGSDVQPLPWVLDRAMGGVMALEHAWLRLGLDWRWGSSLLLVATRP